MNIADYLVKKLEELGINDFFGLPGDYNFELLYAIENNPNTYCPHYYIMIVILTKFHLCVSNGGNIMNKKTILN